ncbi:diphthine--ammonia ligase [Homalodisca vitripennis]|nr:diphthine--ammonia ligase [Homalodisca vitripennis]
MEFGWNCLCYKVIKVEGECLISEGDGDLMYDSDANIFDDDENEANSSSASNPSLSQTRPREEPLTEAELKAVLEYTLVRLYRGDPQPTSRVCALRALRRVGYGPTSGAIHSALAQLSDYQVVPTILPVCQLNHPNIFLSLWALRHQ